MLANGRFHDSKKIKAKNELQIRIIDILNQSDLINPLIDHTSHQCQIDNAVQ